MSRKVTLDSHRSFAWISFVIGVCCFIGRAQGQYPYGPPCPGGFDGCGPRRPTYGYYETSWRKWPTEKPTMAPKPAAEQVPTPAPAEPKRQPPAQEPEPTPPTREREEPSMPLPSTEPPPSLFENLPSEPTAPAPSVPELPGMPSAPQEPTPLEGLPSLPPPSSPGDKDDAPPRMPDDDPFKDEPPELPKSSLDKEPRREMLGSSPADDSKAEALAARWRLTPRTQRQPVLQEPQRIDSPTGSEPTLLPATPEAKSDNDAAPRIESVKPNALRTSMSRPRDVEVAQAAHWTAENPREKPSELPKRKNPLRAR